MKIAVINFSGNVGKSTIARHLLAPRIPAATVIAIESINADAGAGEASEKMRAQQFGELQQRLLLEDNIVADVGASNVETFVSMMGEFDGSHEDFDLFVVPVVQAEKQQRDTIQTILNLSVMGIPANRIRLIFNMVDRIDADVPRIFAPMFDFYAQSPTFVLRTGARIYQSDVYKRLVEAGTSIDKILSDDTDYKNEIAKAAAAAEKARLTQLLMLRRMAGRVKDELDTAFDALTA
jgi:MinD-like ATPase involved in chromosome partitioning or flagellar assembly